jgi:hypothetical protein
MSHHLKLVRWSVGLVLSMGLLSFGNAQSRAVRAQPTITALVPNAVMAGGKIKIRVLGLNLATARELVFPGTGLAPVRLTERKAAEVPKGLEMKDVGDLQFEAELVVPAPPAWGLLPVAVQCDAARSESVILPVRSAADTANEREPNNAFNEANPLAEGRPMLGVVHADKDVDVFTFEANAGDRFEVTLSAGTRASLLDGVVSVFDGERRLLASANAVSGNDSLVKVEVRRPGPHYVVVSDAADRGAVWCGYELLLKRMR